MPAGSPTINWTHYADKVIMGGGLLDGGQAELTIGQHFKEPKNNDQLVIGQFEMKLYRDDTGMLVFAVSTIAHGNGMTIYGPFIEYQLDFDKKISWVVSPFGYGEGFKYKGYCN